MAAQEESRRRDGLLDLVALEPLPSRRVATSLLRVLLALAGFAAGLYGITHLGPAYLEPSFIAARFEAIAGLQDEMGVLFIGNSRVNHHIDPLVADEVLAASGEKLESYTFGVGSMNAVETSYALDELLDDGFRPRKIVLDPGDLRTSPRGNNAESERFIRWHDWRRTLWVYEHFNERIEDEEKRRRKFEPHLRAFLYRTLNIGRGPRLLGVLFREWCAWGLESTGCAEAIRYRAHVAFLRKHRGFVPLHDGVGLEEFFDPSSLAKVLAQRRAFEQDGGPAMQRVRARLRSRRRRRPHSVPGLARTVLNRFAASAARGGAELTILLNPRPDTGADYVYELKREGGIERLLDYGRPKKHPELYAAEGRFENSHLHQRATRAFTTMVVSDLTSLGTPP